MHISACTGLLHCHLENFAGHSQYFILILNGVYFTLALFFLYHLGHRPMESVPWRLGFTDLMVRVLN